jgi:transposase-like protein
MTGQRWIPNLLNSSFHHVNGVLNVSVSPAGETVTCVHCGSDEAVKRGTTGKDAQQYWCKACENRHSFLRQWLAKFRGISKHHLQKYLNFLALKLNSSEDWFEKLLCYNVSR